MANVGSVAVQQSAQVNDRGPGTQIDPMPYKQSFHALYTKHKTQKRKVWHDGRIDLTSNHQALLYASEDVPGIGQRQLDSCSDILPAQAQAIRGGTLTNLETDNYLIQVEGPWTPPSANHHQHTINTHKRKPTVSSGMQKILKHKFKKPSFKAPPRQRPHPASTVLATRKKPLQPGELHRQHYGMPPQQSHFSQQPHTPQVNPEGQTSGFQSYIQAPDQTLLDHTRQDPHPALHSIPTRLPQHPQHQQQSPRSMVAADFPSTTTHLPQQTQQQQQPCNIADTEVDSTQLPQEPQRQLQPRNMAARAFQSTSRNGFDPSSYYGEEEEDEVEEPTANPFAIPSPQTTDRIHHPSVASTNTMQQQQEEEPLFPSPSVNTTAQRSTNDLLNLFGSSIPTSQLTTTSSETSTPLGGQVQAGGEFDLPAAESSDEEDDE